MSGPVRELDDLLRGHRTTPEALREGTEQLRPKSYLLMALLMGMVYGLCMGLYAVLTRTPPCYQQMAASAVKVPALFFLTLMVTFPSLYVFSALLGARLSLASALRVLVAAMTVNVTVLASLGPITAFFTLTTTSYPFIKLLNGLFFVVAGAIGIKFLMTMLERTEQGWEVEETAEAVVVENGPGSRGELPKRAVLLPGRSPGRNVFRVWIFLYAFVGAQMGWVLRPFIGDPDVEFTLFEPRGGSIFVDLIKSVGELFS